MTLSVLIIQLLNGLQLGILLFLMSAGLTLILGIVNFVNLAHGSFFMFGAYIAAGTFNATNSFAWAATAALAGTIALGLLVERLVFFRLYEREHLDQVLATFGLILVLNEAARIIWGPAALSLDVPEFLSTPIHIFGLPYPLYRFAIIVVGIAVAVALYFLVHKSRLGIEIRAIASNRVMTELLGINAQKINTIVITLGTALAGLAGLIAGPISAIQAGMGEPVLILALVVIVIGGIGSIKGAFYGALIVGMIDTLGRVFLPIVLRELLERSLAQAIAGAAASILIFLTMAVVLAIRPQGLFPLRSR